MEWRWRHSGCKCPCEGACKVRANRKRAAAAHSAAPAQRARRKVIKVANKDRKAAMTQAGGYRPSSINNDGTDRAAAQARKKKAPTTKAPQCPNCAAGKFHTASRCPVLKKSLMPQAAGNIDASASAIAAAASALGLF